MTDLQRIVLALCLLHYSLAVKVKMTIRSDEDSRDDEEVQVPHETAAHKPKSHIATLMPFIRRRLAEKTIEFEEEKPTTEKKPLHPNDLLFPLIYKQTHINSMFKFGESWYTWSSEKRSDGSKSVSYYICYDEPKHCDDVGWERTDTVPKCAFQIDSLASEDRACLNPFGVEPHSGGVCDGAEQMKVADVVKACGPRIRSLWRFVRVGRRAASAPKPADVNSLVCEDEEECYVSVEYRIHHDRITYSLHEPTRGQTFKSALKRDLPEDTTTTQRPHHTRRIKKLPHEQEHAKKVRIHSKSKTVEGKGVEKEVDSSYGNRRVKNKIKFREENISDDMSE